LIRKVKGTVVVNAGSVGLPFDGDTRAAYAQIVHQNGEWKAEIIRLRYNLKLAQNDFYEYGFFDGGGPLVDLILLELLSGLGQLYQWVTLYNRPIKEGKITVDGAVKEFTKHPVIEPYW
jgi:hypothetical protein